ncbi:MAG: biotin/lipoyl-containing protein [bacterium]
MAYDIAKIIKMFENANIAKMELEVDNIKIKLEKNITEDKEETVVVSKAEEKQKEVPTGVSVTSPVVGTYYAQKSVDKPPFVTKGSVVKKGDVLCIIEAMKVMNEVTAPVSGTILEVYSSSESLVEYDQVLFLIGE